MVKHPKILFIDDILLKFLLVGIANTIVGAGIMFLLYNIAGVSYWISSACNYIAGGVLSFFLNKYFTFQDKKKSFWQIFLFILNLAVCYFIAYFCAKRTVYFLLVGESEKLRGNIALLCGICLYTVFNYLGQRIFVFKNKEKTGHEKADVLESEK